MDWLKTVDCECAQCGTGPCDTLACICSLNLNTAGGNDGYSQIFPISISSPLALYIQFTTYIVKDRLVITADGTTVYDSGCISTGSSPISATVTIPSGTSSVVVTVFPNCEGTTSTLWTLTISC